MDQWLMEAGLEEEDLEGVCSCLKAGILGGHYQWAFEPVEEEGQEARSEGGEAKQKKRRWRRPRLRLNLDRVIWRGVCGGDFCGEYNEENEKEEVPMQATIRSVLYQANNGSNYDDGRAETWSTAPRNAGTGCT